MKRAAFLILTGLVALIAGALYGVLTGWSNHG